MGSGQAAAEESNQVISLFEKLAHAGFELEDAVKMINGALVIGGGEEACITADIARINLRSGALELVKAGAVASMLTRGGGMRVPPLEQYASWNIGCGQGGYRAHGSFGAGYAGDDDGRCSG